MTHPLILILLAGLLASCGAEPPRVPSLPKKEPVAEVGYTAPPTVTKVAASAEGLLLSGQGPSGASIRLASPDGLVLETRASAKGDWQLTVPPASGVRLFGLSTTQGTRTVQAQGYVLLTPQGQGHLLRAGGGAQAIGAVTIPAITAIDFDREGAVVVSGTVPAGSSVTIRADGRQGADGRANSLGRFAISLPQPLSPGSHSLRVFSNGTERSVTLDMSPAASLVEGPFRSTSTTAGLRVDWMTPGGGVQSTVILK